MDEDKDKLTDLEIVKNLISSRKCETCKYGNIEDELCVHPRKMDILSKKSKNKLPEDRFCRWWFGENKDK